MPSVYIFLGVFSLTRHSITVEKTRKSFSQPEDLLILSLAIAFFILIFVAMYPQTALLRGYDISQHLELSTTLSRTPIFYSSYNYLLYHSYQASLLSLSGEVDILYTQSVLASLIVMLPIGFYAMAKEYLETIDKRLPSIATLFWCLFQAGYGWIYFSALQATSNLSTLDLLKIASDKTYFSTTSGIFGNYFLPVTVVFSMFCLLMVLLKRQGLSQIKYVVLTSFIIASMFLIHVAESAFFVIFLVIWGIISKDAPENINNALKASLFGFIIVLATYFGISNFITLIWSPEVLAALLLPLLLTLISLGLRKSTNWWKFVSKIASTIKPKRIVLAIAVIALFFYCLAIIAIPYLVPYFNNLSIATTFSVPWFFYPIIFGVSGSLGVIGLFFISLERKYLPLYFILAFLVYSFILGRIISYINVNYTFINFYESRFIPYILLALVFFGSITFLKIKSRINSISKKKSRNSVLTIILIGIITVAGASTTFLNIEYCSLVANDPQNKPTADEAEALDYMRSVLKEDPSAFATTITHQSEVYSRFAFVPEAFSTRNLYAGYEPEFVFPALYMHPAFSHGYLYLDQRDFKLLNSSGYSNNYLITHLIPTLPLIFKNSQIEIYNISRTTPPLAFSDQVLVVPFNPNNLSPHGKQLFCYDLLSVGQFNYTTSFDEDDKLLNAQTLLLSFDPTGSLVEGRPVEDYVNYVNSGGNLVILNTGDFGYFGGLFFSPLSDVLSATSIDVAEKIHLSEKISVPLLKTNQDVKILSNYTSSEGSSPYISEMKMGRGQLFYVNINPLIEFINQGNAEKSEIYSIIGHLLDSLPLRHYEDVRLPESAGEVREIILEGAVSVNSTSLVFPSLKELVSNGGKSEVTVIGSTVGSAITYCNVTSINLSGYSQATIKSNETSIKDGQSFYSCMNFGESTQVCLASPASLALISNGELFELSAVSKILISMDAPVVIWVRNPSVAAQSGIFKESSYSLKDAGGGDVVTSDGVLFTIYVSDSYSVLSTFKIGQYTASSPPYYDELGSLWKVNTQAILLAVFFAIIFIPLLLHKKHKKIVFRRKPFKKAEDFSAFPENS